MAILRHALAQSGKVAVEGGEIGYRLYTPHDKTAATRAPLIAVHGGPGNSHAMMYDCLHALADDRPVAFYDQLGSHYSPGNLTPDLMRLDRFADEVKCLANTLKFDKFFLLGQSWGSAVSTQFALDHPKRVAGLILSGPHLSTPRWIADCNRLLAALPPEMQATIRRCEADGTTDSPAYKEADLFFSKKHLMRCDPWPTTHGDKHNREIYMTMWGPSEFTCHGLLRDMDLFPRLHEIVAPTLLICGEFDTAAPETVRDAARLMKNARVEVIADSGHVSYGDRNEAYMRVVQEFLRGRANA